MTSINIVALRKKFSFVRWRLFGAFCQNTYMYLFYVYFHRTGCPKKWTMPWSGLKIEIYDFNNCSCYPKKCFPLWGGNFHEPLVPNTYIPLFKVYFHHTGCPKKWKMPWNGLKNDVYVCISLFLDERIPKGSAS